MAEGVQLVIAIYDSTNFQKINKSAHRAVAQRANEIAADQNET
jgi:hypothetical protein